RATRHAWRWLKQPAEREESRSCFPPPAEYDERSKCEYRAQAGEPYGIHDDNAVLPRFRVVVIAIKQDPIDQRPDFVLTRLNETQPKIARRELDSIEILGNASVRGEHHDRTDVRPLLRLVVPLEPVSDRIRQLPYGFGGSR